MIIYFKCLFDVVEANSKMKANNLPFLCSPPKTFFIDHSYSSDAHLHWVSWKDMFENVFFWWGVDIKFHRLYILCHSPSFYFMSGKITLHVILSQDCEKYLSVELNIFPMQLFIKEKWPFIVKQGCFFWRGEENLK